MNYQNFIVSFPEPQIMKEEMVVNEISSGVIFNVQINMKCPMEYPNIIYYIYVAL